MARLFPAITQTSIPAFDGRGSARFYFNLSILNTREEVKSCYIRIRSINNNRNPLSMVSFPRGVRFFTDEEIKYDTKIGKYYIDIPGDSFSTDTSGDFAGFNQFYKIQMILTPYKLEKAGNEYKFEDVYGNYILLTRDRLIDGENTVFSEWSAPTLMKPIIPPDVSFTFEQILSPIFNFVGSYRNVKDPLESLSKYHFEILDNTNQEVVETGEEKRIGLYEAETIAWQNKTQLKEKKEYKVILHYTTKNGYVGKVTNVFETAFTSTKLDVLMAANNNEDLGAVDLSLVFKTKLYSTDNLIIHRASLAEGGKLDFKKMAKINGPIDRIIKYRDYTIEDGVAYIYVVQAENAAGQLGNLTKPAKVIPHFEQYFLLGEGDKQVSVLYDGKIGSITHKTADAVIETLGSKYPYVVRNASLGYKTFSFTGKVTYQQDLQEVFSGDEFTKTISSDSTVNSELEAMYRELLEDNATDIGHAKKDSMVYQRSWRTKFLDWLKDGKPKLLKTPSSGSMLVRITNVSETPITSLSGLISDFSCTMTEIAPPDLESLWRFGILKPQYEGVEMIQKPITFIEFDRQRLVVNENGYYYGVKGVYNPSKIILNGHVYGFDSKGAVISDPSGSAEDPNHKKEQLYDGGARVIVTGNTYGEIQTVFYAGEVK